MPFNFNGTPSANVTITNTGSVTVTDTKRTVTPIHAYRTTTGTSTMGTVPANKVWRIIGANISLSYDETTGKEGYIQANGVTILGTCIVVAANESGSSNNSFDLNYYDAIPITAGQTVTLTGYHVSGTVYYIEETA